MAVEHGRDSEDEESEPISEFHASAREFMDEYRDVLDALDE